MAGTRANRGGQANEAGSVYRRGVGAVLAVHGLRGKGVAALEIPDVGPYPVALAFETLDAVDDIKCKLSDESHLYVQAKRAYGNNSVFADAVQQWLTILDDLEGGDRLVIAAEEIVGQVEALPDALRQRRAGGVLTYAHKNALAALASRASLQQTEERFDKLCAVAHAWRVSASSTLDLGYQHAAEMLDGVVVDTGHGVAAFEVLLAHIHTEAGRASRSTANEWWRWLSDARLPLVGSAQGSLAQRRTAERDALQVYRDQLAVAKDVVELSFVTDAVPPITVSDLLSTARVARSDNIHGLSSPLPDAVRRHQRIVVTGHPGAGKTTALQQLAAHFAHDTDTPLPVVVKLPRACADVHDPQDVTTELLLSDAIGGVPKEHQHILRQVLARELAQGFAVLICDGLDECHACASAVVDGLARLQEQFGPDVGVLVATRASAIRSARKLDFAEVTLQTPTGIHDVQRRILNTAMDRAQVGNADERASRQGRLKQLQTEQPDIVNVPLLGNLIAALIGSTPDSRIPGTVPDILEEAVNQSLAQWERNRSREAMQVPGVLEAIGIDLLLDGFQEIGRLIAGQSQLPRSAALAGVTHKLRDGWGKAPREAEALAAKIVEFWDATISVFIETEEGSLTARSRVFADLADAMWVGNSSQADKFAWLDAVLDDETRFDNFILAVTKFPGLADLALEGVAPSSRRRRLIEWLCDAADRVALSSTAIETMLAALVAYAHDAGDWLPSTDVAPDNELSWSQRAQLNKDGYAWPFVRRAALLPMAPDLRATRATRDALLARVSGDAERAATAAALAATTDARYDERSLTAAEIGAVSILLTLPLPERPDPPIKQQRNRFSIAPTVPMLSGRPLAALRAAQLLDQFPPGTSELFDAFVKAAPSNYAELISQQLARRGITTAAVKELVHAMQRLVIDRKPIPLPAALSEIAAPAAQAQGELWWCRELFALYDLMQVGQSISGELELANDEPHRTTMVEIARLYCAVNGLDAGHVSAQVSHAATQGAQALDNLDSLATRGGSEHPSTNSLTEVDEEQRNLLVDALTSPCQWLGQLAFFVSLTLKDDELCRQADRQS